MSSTTTSASIDALREIFSTHGIPDVVVSDNGPQFISSEYYDFLKINAIRHSFAAPYHPSGNGQAERMVQSTKDSLKRMLSGNWKKKLANFLLRQHITPSCTTRLSPAELLMRRRLKTYLDRMHPDLVNDLRTKQENFATKELENHNYRAFSADDPVYIKNYGRGSQWIPATVVQPSGPVSYKAETPAGDVVRRHVDQMRERFHDHHQNQEPIAKDSHNSTPPDPHPSTPTRLSRLNI